VLGYRVNALRIRRRKAAPAPAADEASGAWYRIARSVMRRPVAYVAVTVVLLLALGSPFRSITWGGTDARALPANAAPRVVSEALASDVPANATTPIEAVVKFAGPADAPARQAALAGYLTRLRHVPGVVAGQVTGVRATWRGWICVTPATPSPRPRGHWWSGCARCRRRPGRRCSSAA